MQAVADVQATTVNFVSEYVLRPIRQIYATVRYDASEFAVQSAESLSSDIESLVRFASVVHAAE